MAKFRRASLPRRPQLALGLLVSFLGGAACTPELDLSGGARVSEDGLEAQGIASGVQFVSVSNGGRYPNGFALQVRAPAATRYVVYSSDGYVLGISTKPERAYAVRPQFYSLGEREIVARAFDADDAQLGEARVTLTVEAESWSPGAPSTSSGASGSPAAGTNDTFRFVSPATEGGQYDRELLLSVQAPAATSYVVYSADGYVLGVAVDEASGYAVRTLFTVGGNRTLVARAFNSSDAQLGEITRRVVINGAAAGQGAAPGSSAPSTSGGSSSGSTSNPPPASSRAAAAQTLLAHHHARRLTFWDQTFGRYDQADPLSNITDTAQNRAAKTSCYGGAPCNTVYLQQRLLDAMVRLREVNGYSYFVTAIAGARHSPGSYHFSGRAFDIDEINGVRVYGDSALTREFMNACWARGAVEVFGPSNDPSGHWDHIHCAF